MFNPDLPHTAIPNPDSSTVDCLLPDLKADIDTSKDTLTDTTKHFRDAIAPASPETPSTVSLLLAR